MTKLPNLNKPKKEFPPHYIVTVAGSYVFKDENGEKARGSYEFNIPVPLQVTAMVPVKRFDARTQNYFWEDEQKNLRIVDFGILSYLIKEQRIQNKIKKICPTFIALMKHEIIKTIGSTPDVVLPSNPHCLSKEQLLKFIKSNSWPIDTTLFSTLKELREAVMNYKESPESYELFETMIRRRRATGKAFTHAQEELEAMYEDAGDLEETPEV